jgi:hypothetical protein
MYFVPPITRMRFGSALIIPNDSDVWQTGNGTTSSG